VSSDGSSIALSIVSFFRPSSFWPGTNSLNLTVKPDLPDSGRRLDAPFLRSPTCATTVPSNEIVAGTRTVEPSSSSVARYCASTVSSIACSTPGANTAAPTAPTSASAVGPASPRASGSPAPPPQASAAHASTTNQRIGRR
jgi:uncharacterized membrane protein